MNMYHPDKWVLVKIDVPKTPPLYKILASWYGGFAGGDSWKISSGVTNSVFEEEVLQFENNSGSTYIGALCNYGMSSYTYGVYSGWLADATGTDVSVSIVPEEEVLDLVKNNQWGNEFNDLQS